MNELDKVKERQRLEAFDIRTGLFSIHSAYAREDLRARISLAARTNPPAPIAFIFLDLDNLKPSNDAFGESGGDSLLEAFARAIKKTFRDYDFKFREGTKGDEFGVVAIGLSQEKLPEKLKELSANFATECGDKMADFASFSAGACYLKFETKNTNRGNEIIYEDIVLTEEEIENRLRDRLENGGGNFSIYSEHGPKPHAYKAMEKAKAAGKNRLVLCDNGEFLEAQVLREDYEVFDRNRFENLKKQRTI